MTNQDATARFELQPRTLRRLQQKKVAPLQIATVVVALLALAVSAVNVLDSDIDPVPVPIGSNQYVIPPSIGAQAGNQQGWRGVVIEGSWRITPMEEYTYKRHPEGGWVLTSVDYGEPGQKTERCVANIDQRYEWIATEEGACDWDDAYAQHENMPRIFPESI